MDKITFIVKKIKGKGVELEEYTLINNVKLNTTLIIEHISEIIYNALKRDLLFKITYENKMFNINVMGNNIHPKIAYEFFDFEFIHKQVNNDK